MAEEKKIDKNNPASKDKEQKTLVIVWVLVIVIVGIIGYRIVNKGNKKTNDVEETTHESYLDRDIVRDLESRYYLRKAEDNINLIRTNIAQLQTSNEDLERKIAQVDIRKPRVIKEKLNEKKSDDLPDLITR